jgi:hypothetical protein
MTCETGANLAPGNYRCPSTGQQHVSKQGTIQNDAYFLHKYQGTGIGLRTVLTLKFVGLTRRVFELNNYYSLLVPGLIGTFTRYTNRCVSLAVIRKPSGMYLQIAIHTTPIEIVHKVATTHRTYTI